MLCCRLKLTFSKNISGTLSKCQNCLQRLSADDNSRTQRMEVHVVKGLDYFLLYLATLDSYSYTFNPFKESENSYPHQLDESIFQFLSCFFYLDLIVLAMYPQAANAHNFQMPTVGQASDSMTALT